MRIALTGNPNSGKTTMFNALTGRNEKVGNWAGVTVEKKEHPIKKNYFNSSEELIVVDLPGAYSMSPFTSEESVTSSYVKNENPDVIINIVDATNLSRSLFFTTQLLELGIPVVVALNKADINKKKDTKIDTKELSARLGCPVVDTVSTSADGLSELIKKAIEQIGNSQKAPYVQSNVDLTNKSEVIAADKRRFAFVNSIVKAVETRKIATKEKNYNDKIDAVLTNRFAGIAIFVLVMWAVFWISQVSLGPIIAEGYEFSNGTAIPGLVTLIEIFGQWVAGLVEGTAPILQTILVDGIIGGVGAVIGFLPLVMVMYFLLALLEDCGYMARVSVVLDPIFKRVGLSGKSIIPIVIGTGCAIPGIMACRTIRDERERRATAMLAPFIPCGAKIPVIALFAGAFFPESNWVSPLVYFTGIILIFGGALLVKTITAHKYRKSFFIIELPEYKIPSIRRAAITMLGRAGDYIIKAGTVILVCNALVSILASYTWSLKPAQKQGDYAIIAEADEENDEITSFVVTDEQFASISANATQVAGNTLYLTDASSLKAFGIDAEDGEEPIYVVSDSLLAQMGLEREIVADVEASMLHDVATPFAWIMIPLGFGMWQLAAAAVTGFIAKEEVVGTLATVFAISSINEDFELASSAFGTGTQMFGITAAAGLAYLMFNLFTPPCFAAIGAMNSEMKSKKWLFAGIGLQFAVGYTVSFLVYQIGTLITEGNFGNGFIGGLVAVIAIIAVIAYLAISSKKKAAAEYAAKNKNIKVIL